MRKFRKWRGVYKVKTFGTIHIIYRVERFIYYHVTVVYHASGFLKPFLTTLTPTPHFPHSRSHIPLTIC